MPKPTRICSYEGCERRCHAKGLCKSHHQQQVRGEEVRPLQLKGTFTERFWAKVNKGAPGGCWEWTAATSEGYGHIGVDGRVRYAHRVSWELVNGPVPDGMVIDHRCSNPSCVNPEHLRAVTQSQNMQHLTGPSRNNTSGVRGVSWSAGRSAWLVQVKLRGRRYHGGYHSTLEAAERAVKALRARLHTHDDHDEWLQTQG